MPSVAVIGGGYAGVAAVQRLAALLDSTWSIVLVDRNSYHQLTARLPEVIAGSIRESKACIPYSQFLPKRVAVQQAEVIDIDPDTRTVKTSGSESAHDALIVALGSAPDFLNVSGGKEHSLVLRSISDAVRIRNQIRELLRSHDHAHVVIVGAGYTGTEVAGEFVEQARRALAMTNRHLETTVVAQDSHLLPEGNHRLAPVAERLLRAKGVSFVLGKAVQEISSNEVRVEGSLSLSAELVVWAAHSTVAAPIPAGSWTRGQDGRIHVDPYLRSVAHDRVYIAGDVGLPYDYERGTTVPPNAQLAVQEGRLAAKNLVAGLNGRPLEEFKPRILGEALSLGGRDGVAEVAGLVVSGRAALAVKRGALARYLTNLGGFQLASQYR